MHKAYYSFFKS